MGHAAVVGGNTPFERAMAVDAEMRHQAAAMFPAMKKPQMDALIAAWWDRATLEQTKIGRIVAPMADEAARVVLGGWDGAKQQRR